MTAALSVLLVLLGSQISLTLHLASTPTRTSSSNCAFLITNRLVEGGRQTTCLKSVGGFPSPHAKLKSSGTMVFVLKGGSLHARFSSILAFAGDGVHARQTVRGSVTGGTGRYRGCRGTVAATGTVVDRPTALGPVRATYRLTLARGSC